MIEIYYQNEGQKIQHQSRLEEFQCNERTSIYHHELHKKVIKKGAILRLQTEDGMLEGHSACAKFLEKTVEDLLLHPAHLNSVAKQSGRPFVNQT